MKIKVNYDFTQQELFGNSDVFEVADAAKLGDLLRLIDAKIMEAGKKKGIETTYKTILAGDQLNACMIFINGSAPKNIPEHELHDGDTVEFVYGFCGG
ncbi:hypothetical protein METP3_02276 [Methanosarcinales archaeon]|nr:hypothetical protein METP3_02276 [Methanosarcinales archaeon]